MLRGLKPVCAHFMLRKLRTRSSVLPVTVEDCEEAPLVRRCQAKLFHYAVLVLVVLVDRCSRERTQGEISYSSMTHEGRSLLIIDRWLIYCSLAYRQDSTLSERPRHILGLSRRYSASSMMEEHLSSPVSRRHSGVQLRATSALPM